MSAYPTLMTMSEPETIRTQIIVLSDSHGTKVSPAKQIRRRADVAIHCGDLTEESKLEEFADTLDLLQAIGAPLKLVIAGNHDFTLDTPTFRRKVATAQPALDPTLVEKTYGEEGQARNMLEDARSLGISFLDEGRHAFVLENGAKLTVYASPWTPAQDDNSSVGDWGYQYPRSEGHHFDIKPGVDIAITHGPPRGILDMEPERQRAGCPDLFGAIAASRPQLHCFGHIHSGWGAKLVTWRPHISEPVSHFTAIDNEGSVLIENLNSLRPSKYDDEQGRLAKLEKAAAYREQGCCASDHSSQAPLALTRVQQTLFVNAAIISDEQDDELQLPWFVEIDLPKA